MTALLAITPAPTSVFGIVSGQMSLEKVVPFVHSVDLMLEPTLTRASRQVSFSPFTVTSSQLFNTDRWILTIVTINIIFKITSFTIISWTTMRKLISIIESTTLITAIEVTLHTFSIVSEFLNPGLLRWKEIKPLR